MWSARMDDCIIFFSEVTSHDITSYGDRVVIWVWRMEDLMKFFRMGWMQHMNPTGAGD